MAPILLIEDNTVLRDMLKTVLDNEGFEVLATEDGAAGLGLMKQQEPDLVITDIVMPEMDGLEVIRSIRSNYPHTKIIAMSGGGYNVDADLSLFIAGKVGADRVLNKPFDLHVFLETIKELLCFPNPD